MNIIYKQFLINLFKDVQITTHLDFLWRMSHYPYSAPKLTRQAAYRVNSTNADVLIPIMCLLLRKVFFPYLFFYVYIESLNPKNPEGPTPQYPNPNSRPQPPPPYFYSYADSKWLFFSASINLSIAFAWLIFWIKFESWSLALDLCPSTGHAAICSVCVQLKGGTGKHKGVKLDYLRWSWSYSANVLVSYIVGFSKQVQVFWWDFPLIFWPHEWSISQLLGTFKTFDFR